MMTYIPVAEVGDPALVLLYRGCVLPCVHLPELETPICTEPEVQPSRVTTPHANLRGL